MGRTKKVPKTIYFTNGHATEEDYAEAEAIGPGVVFRRADLIVEGDPLETFDRVAGDVPPAYAAKAAEKDASAAETPPAEPPKADPAAVKPGSPVKPPEPAKASGTGGGWKPNA